MVGNGITGEMGAKIYKETTQKGEQLITDKVSETRDFSFYKLNQII